MEAPLLCWLESRAHSSALKHFGEAEIRIQLNAIRQGGAELIPSLAMDVELAHAESMTTLDDFKALRASVPADVQQELYGLMVSNPDAA